MPAAFLLAATVAAVLCPREVTFVDTGTGAVVGTAALPGEGLGVFAAPDGRVVVPLAAVDATAVADPTGRVEQWRGRVFPMFFADFDRMHVVLPGKLATLSYPERVPLVEVPLPDPGGARRAACSADGRLVAVIPASPAGRTLTLVAALEGGTTSTVRLDDVASAVALSPDGGFAVVAAGGVLAVTGAGRTRPIGVLDLGGEIRALACTADGRSVLAGRTTGAGSEIVGVRVDVAAKNPLRERFRSAVPGAVAAIAAAEEEVAAVTGDALVILSGDGRRVRRKVALPGAADVTILPKRSRSPLPSWSDSKTP